jgi:hypothetical protein
MLIYKTLENKKGGGRLKIYSFAIKFFRVVFHAKAAKVRRGRKGKITFYFAHFLNFAALCKKP